jgi:hypothetical protein
MIKEFENITGEITALVDEWERKLLKLHENIISGRRNVQNRTIKQITGHMIDSASNNTHRIVHLQYRQSPLRFPNYAVNGNNDRWIMIQNYQGEKWTDLVQLWKYAHMHIVHVIKNINPDSLENEWISESEDGNISLRAMVIDFLRHLQLHLGEIDDLLHLKQNDL